MREDRWTPRLEDKAPIWTKCNRDVKQLLQLMNGLPHCNLLNQFVSPETPVGPIQTELEMKSHWSPSCEKNETRKSYVSLHYCLVHASKFEATASWFFFKAWVDFSNSGRKTILEPWFENLKLRAFCKTRRLKRQMKTSVCKRRDLRRVLISWVLSDV